MNVVNFIDEKAPQLAFYATHFLQGQLLKTEVDHYVWQTLEEWQQYQADGEAETSKEQVFWFLLHELNHWPESVLRGNRFLTNRLLQCSLYLKGKAEHPPECIGIRPVPIKPSRNSVA